MTDNSHLTAIARTSVSRPVKDLTGFFTGRVLDYGCGRGFDAEHLGAEKYDAHYFPEKPFGRFDVVLCNYVVNTIVNESDRVLTVGRALRFVTNGGLFIITSRSINEIEKNAKIKQWAPCETGYITGRSTFQKGHTAGMLNDLVFQALSSSVVIQRVAFTKNTSAYAAQIYQIGRI